ncbi:acyl-CoA thioesterase [Roseateles sp. BYS180W]|uniref:Acyl-CoA thioesterase n=1 Tax=Roseateles rivi TaxID=3299028 RepID=A0ABW7FUW5_9BURK
MAQEDLQLHMTVLMTPDMANFAGNVHGGAILRLMDQVAYSCAARYASCYVVTASVDRVSFRRPVRVGELVTFMASVNYTGQSSMEVGMKVVAEEICSRTQHHCNSSYFTMVAVDPCGRPVQVPRLVPVTLEQWRRHEEAQIRRRLKYEMEQQHKELMAQLDALPPGNYRMSSEVEYMQIAS